MSAENPQDRVAPRLTDEASATDGEIGQMSQAAGSLIKEILEQVRQPKGDMSSSDPAARVFFPNGVELFYVKLEATLERPPRLSAEVKIAGEKGLGKAGGPS